MIDIEQSIADSFNASMKNMLAIHNLAYHFFSLGGQDKIAGADYLISNASGFALIEFKAREGTLITERVKQRRETLCLLLQKNKKMRDIHDQCHFVVWPNASNEIMCAPYRAEICNKTVFPKCTKLTRENPLLSRRVRASTYCSEFINPPPPRHAQKADFELYFEWLLKKTSGSDKSTVQLIGMGDRDFSIFRFESVDAAYKYMQNASTSKPVKRKKAKP